MFFFGNDCIVLIYVFQVVSSCQDLEFDIKIPNYTHYYHTNLHLSILIYILYDHTILLICSYTPNVIQVAGSTLIMFGTTPL